VLDVLGFARRAAQMAALDARTRFLDPVFKAALDAELVINRDFEKAATPIRLHFVSFADTAVLLLPRAPTGILARPNQVVESLAYACALVVATCMWLDVPLRGAMAYGEVLYSDDPVFVLGKPVFEAHAVERKQDWAGVALCESATSLVNEDDTLRCVYWHVPLKTGVDRRLVVDWPAHSVGPSQKVLNLNGESSPGPSPDWDACFGRDEHGATKRQNTVAFFEARDSARRFSGATVGPEQRQLVGHWEEMYRQRRGAS
jgi:hypothetical protein